MGRIRATTDERLRYYDRQAGVRLSDQFDRHIRRVQLKGRLVNASLTATGLGIAAVLSMLACSLLGTR